MTYVANDMVNVTRQIIYTQMLQRRFQDWLLGQHMINDRTSEFPDGDTAYFDQIGQRSVHSYSENTAVDFSKIDTSRISLKVTEYLQDGFAITDKQKQDSYKSALFWATNVQESMLGFERRLESDILATALQQVANNANTINGQPHRITCDVDSGANPITLDKLNDMKLAMDMARVPAEGRILIIDPTNEHELNKLVQITQPTTGDLNNTDVNGIINTGFGNRLMFNRQFFGFNIMISHNLPDMASGATDGTTALAKAGKLNIAMCLASADASPFMGVIRQSPTSEFNRNTTFRRDEYSATSRWGFALQRPESLVTLLTS